MPRDTRLTLAEREEISRSVAAGQTVRATAQQLGRAPSTISRELRQRAVTPATYRALIAQHVASHGARPPRRPRKLLTHPQLRAHVQARLARRWSPGQLAKQLAGEYPGDRTMRVSHETIYTSRYALPRGALKRALVRALRQARPPRRRRSRVPDRRGTIPDMLSITERPAEVADRTIPGHWEGDLLMGRRNASALGTLVERTTRLVLLVPLLARDAATVRQAFAAELQTRSQQVTRSLTYDHGKEMAKHRLFTQATQIRVCFAHPHSPWERGTHENTNGLLRQFFPKGTDFARVSPQEIKRVQALLNGRPRRVLDWQTPSEVFHAVLHEPVALGT